MWYRYFCKESWNLRIWRKANLKFNQDDFGMLRHKLVARWRDFVYRAARTEGTIRGSNWFIGIGGISVLLWWKSTWYDEKFTKPNKEKQQKVLEEKDAEAKQKLFFNKFGGPSRPHRSLEDLIVFMAGSWTYDQFADFLSYNAGMDINMDMQKGLDSWMSPEDKKMLLYYQKSIGRKVEE